MEFYSQSFTAPTLDKKPKLGKKMVSSSVFRGASKAIGKSTTIKIPKGMQIGASKSYVDPSYLRKEESTPIEQTLVETNNILVEIQNQLAVDFAYRIAKEKEDIQKIKIASDKEKKSRAEAGVESVKKIGGFVKNQVDKVTAPVKGFFQKILDFFGAIIRCHPDRICLGRKWEIVGLYVWRLLLHCLCRRGRSERRKCIEISPHVFKLR